MATVDYSLLFDRTPHLALAYDPANPHMRWAMLDETGQLYARASTLKQAVSFMRAAERKGHATIDEVSVAHHSRLADPAEWESLWRSYQRVLEADGHSVRADVLSERSEGGLGVPARTGIASDREVAQPSSRSESASNVLPFRPRMAEPVDEVGA